MLAEEEEETAEACAEVEAEAGLEIDAGGARPRTVSSCSSGARLGAEGTGNARLRESKAEGVGSPVGRTSSMISMILFGGKGAFSSDPISEPLSSIMSELSSSA